MKLTPILILTLLLFSCNKDVRFDSNEWNRGGLDWQITDTRENMVSDLLASDTLIGLTKPEVIKLIGKPEFDESNKIKVLIREKYTGNIDPDYISYLIIDFNQLGSAIKCYVEK